ncbi:hypothetical protein MGYG_01510 [Nannizzia gypsea CBS 118893]|uniref:Uncharacterized protein n=1 Tax=Arthroderma gypseum (strain ATCC MYA-4604 / CBS 118893) TaxID=535722 RepID=E5R193_ARTGP|nr:hypothetical protein MGYG_01510 [Nannizzia gypsea CBS 118893]EFQ98482.1 hypothetical protein MGYG_01510 [Nannizzia gypsea CBS 118893]
MQSNGTAENKQTNSNGQSNGQSERSKCRDIFLFSVSRTLSNVFCRLLSAQPGWVQSDYHFQEGFFHAREQFQWAPLAEISDEMRLEYIDQAHKGVEALQKAREDAIRQDKHIFVKNHSFFAVEPSALLDKVKGGKELPSLTIVPRPLASEQEGDVSTTPTRPKTNPTFLPDEYLALWQPVFIIRHPALVVESWYRAETRVSPVNVRDRVWSYLSFRYSRSLYDWYASNATASNGTETAVDGKGASFLRPIVVEADDILSGECLTKFCDACGMSAEHIKYEWEQIPPEGQDVSVRHLSYLGGLWQSTGLDQSKSSKGLDMDVRYGKWKEEFGDSVAEGLYEPCSGLMLIMSIEEQTI